MIAKPFALFKKDFHSELRTRYAINSLAMFIIVAISVILFSIGTERITESLTGGIFWVVIFFTAMSGLARAFVSEEERGTVLTLQLIASPSTVFSGKLVFNVRGKLVSIFQALKDAFSQSHILRGNHHI